MTICRHKDICNFPQYRDVQCDHREDHEYDPGLCGKEWCDSYGKAESSCLTPTEEADRILKDK